MKALPKFSLTSSPSKFQNFIFSWWKYHKRDLPWRRTHDPYKILISEVMLQQTQVSRVLVKYKEFLEKFPTLSALRKASVSDVLRTWKGMGYNRRALYLKKITSIPKTERELVRLPGIGVYTARAILVFAYKQDVVLIDTNIRKIITHFFFHDTPQKESQIQEVADWLLPKGKSWEWHQALMDYGTANKLKVHKVRKSKPFKNSSRYYRGMVVDRLREKAVFAGDLNVKPEIIEGLIRDGLVVRSRDNMLHLPLS